MRGWPWTRAYEFGKAGGKASLFDLLRWSPSAHRLPCLLGARRDRLARAADPRLFLGGRDQVAQVAHMNASDNTLVFVYARPRRGNIERVKARMGWEMPWYPHHDRHFDTDSGGGGVDECTGTERIHPRG